MAIRKSISKNQIQYKDRQFGFRFKNIFYFRTANRLLLLRLSWLLVQKLQQLGRHCPAEGVSTCNFLFSILGSY
jgi:hypothetical protein